MINDRWTFFRAFLRSPRVVASVIPSSPVLEKRVVEAAQVRDAKVVVELGPGTGGMTRALLAAMPKDARLIAFERTSEFVRRLSTIDDDRLEVIEGCASTVAAALRERGLSGADAIVSGIPFSTLPADLAQTIASAVADALSPGARFVAYQVVARVADYMNPLLGRSQTAIELLNIPPTRVFTWQKHNAVAAHG